MVKNQPIARLRARARKLRITRIADFGLLLPKSASVLLKEFFFLCVETLATFRDQSAMTGKHLSQKLPLALPYNPKIWPKRPWGVQFFLHFCQEAN